MIHTTRINIFTPHRLKQIVEEMGLRQWDLAHSLQISQSTLSKYLSGICTMPLVIESQLIAILKILQSQKMQQLRKPIARRK